MKNITINGVKPTSDLDRKIKLSNGAIIIQKENDNVVGVYLVISFRDNKNKYREGTSEYCSLVNLDTGQLAFEERCSRATSERRILRHLTRTGCSMVNGVYDPDDTSQDYRFKNMRIQVYQNGNYNLDITLGEEWIIGGTR